MTPTSLADFLRWLAIAPASTTIAAPDLRAILEPLAVDRTTSSPVSPPDVPAATWREKLWSVPPETRLGVREAAEACGRPVSWIYRHTSEKSASADDRLPHKKFDGELTFVVGELRAWLTAHEETVKQGGPVASLTLSPRRAS